MAEQSIHAVVTGDKSTIPATIRPNSLEDFQALLTSRVCFSTSTPIGALQAYTRRGEEHWRAPFEGLAELADVINCDGPASRLVALALEVANTAATACAFIQDARTETDPSEVTHLLDQAKRYTWSAARNADILGVGLAKLAVVGLRNEENEGQS